MTATTAGYDRLRTFQNKNPINKNPKPTPKLSAARLAMFKFYFVLNEGEKRL